MQRPRRIIVFGVLCLIVGGLTGFKNTMEAVLSAVGPGGLEQMVVMMEEMDQPLNKSQQQDFNVQIRTLRKPVYRIGQGIESVGSAVMSLMLIVTGIGLLGDRVWSLKLGRWWAYFAIPAGAVSVVLSVRYMMPEMPEATTGGVMFSGALMLVVVWTLPVLLLTQLPNAVVKQYLAARQARRTASNVMPRPQQTASDAPDTSTPPRSTGESARPTPAATNLPPTQTVDTNWRDDPWNDPTSQ